MTELATKALLEPILDGGLRNPYFFNGRLLTAEDLQGEQAAQQWHRARLGRAIGAGVVEGLAVSIKSATVAKAVLNVGAGLAITPEGQAVALPRNIYLELAPQVEAVPPKGGQFAPCAADRLTAWPTGMGVYILVLAPDTGFSAERAPASGPEGDGRVTGCGSRYQIDGVRFRLVKLEPADLPAAADPAGLRKQLEPASGEDTEQALRRTSLLRNRLTHLCTEGVGRYAAARDPLADVAPAGILAALLAREGDNDKTLERRLTPCDVPLALVYWTTGGIGFVDMWSVRRRPAPPVPTAGWPLGLTLGAPATAEAGLLQFAEHLTWLGERRTEVQLKALRANDYFRYLPAAGLLPLAGVAGQAGYDYKHFFDGVPYRDNGAQPHEQAPLLTGLPVIEGAQAEAILRAAQAYPPIDLRAALVDKQERPELIWLYRVRENKQVIDEAKASPPQPYLIFASGHLPEFGPARANQARWGYSNFR